MIVGMIFGIVIGALLGGIIGSLVIDCCDDNCEAKGWATGIGIGIITVALIGVFGSYINTTSKLSFIEQVKSAEYTYTQSVEDKRISGFERIELTKSIMDINREIAMEKAYNHTLWNIEISDAIKQQIDDMKYIG